ATLRQRFRSFVLPVTAFFLAWYFLYVLLAAFAPHYMATKVIGNVNIGLIVGLLQFVSTFAITTAYVRFASRNLDPLGSQICERVEGGAW
ncbi:MAG: rane protein, partial [Pseudonocardiales bacterium]|nr:rane protein [Pseudonocardiales bacterium]